MNEPGSLMRCISVTGLSYYSHILDSNMITNWFIKDFSKKDIGFVISTTQDKERIINYLVLPNEICWVISEMTITEMRDNKIWSSIDL